MKPVRDVDEYIANVPKDMQGRLEELRRAIKTAAPKAEERIGYGMPYYGYKGRLVYFSFWKKHIGLYVPPPIIEEYKNELKDYETSTATIRFPHDKKLPILLIKKLVKTRVKINDAARSKKIKQLLNKRF